MTNFQESFKKACTYIIRATTEKLVPVHYDQISGQYWLYGDHTNIGQSNLVHCLIHKKTLDHLAIKYCIMYWDKNIEYEDNHDLVINAAETEANCRIFWSDYKKWHEVVFNALSIKQR